MGKQYKGFSKEEHEEAAKAINSICKQLKELSKLIIPAYGVSSGVGKEIEKLVLTPNVMCKLKNKLDDAYLEEHGSKAYEGSPYFTDGYA